ncbi:hydrogenobyrinic acid a,c-diamide synthase (glutamine-hydrolysing) /cobyrinate a,c-diamide synthase [Rhodovulum sp. ES.010]|uniref:cobyrinate a,c-diamide synthase n=1 Tax=Rhodovulum sp. ES.010 TaxID=1882821 RepID=UPI0009260681|nr:cobyrinate a,c-diamide synthase [Rhodovulum sp. ES.010]SIO32568.1 hydrogenobyrinic acid a,c-diamide synthase (glutamine-hydrolysing) /cobyrinate a,c-diamide synthase [Rhodovulum sp. ES.010]
MAADPPGLVIAAPASGSGKTTVTLGLLRALRDAGLAVQPFKNGPDYIDPAFHRIAAGRVSFNLDMWAMDEDLLATIAGKAQGADLALSEGSMGLYDGTTAQGVSGRGSSAEIARAFGWPVVLVLDVGGQAQSATATALGFAHHPDAPPLAGVILNRVAGARHEVMIREEMARLGIAVFGALPRRSDLELPERHLGLVQAEEHGDIDDLIGRLGAFLRDHADLSALRDAARAGAPRPPRCWPDPPAQRIALARDAAFSFTYPHLLEGWRRAGAEILPFSPLADEPPPEADLVWLPGGYPELHAGRLAAAGTFLDGLRRHAETRPVHGECGGYMVLGAGLVDGDGERHAMACLLGLVTSYERRRLHLGYRRAVLEAAMPGHAAGAMLYGHEFHYSTILDQPDAPLARVTDAGGNPVPETGSVKGHVTGSFFHLIAEGAA